MALMQKKMTVAIIIIFCIAAGAVLFFMSRKSGLSDELTVMSLSTISDMIFKDLEGKDISVSSLRGRQVVFHIWSSWCLLCIQEIPDMAVLQKEFGDALVVIEVNRAESLEVVKKYADQFNASHNLLFVLDINDALYKEIGGFSMPEVIFVDKNGMIKDHTRGPTDIIDKRRRIQNAFAL